MPEFRWKTGENSGGLRIVATKKPKALALGFMFQTTNQVSIMAVCAAD